MLSALAATLATAVGPDHVVTGDDPSVADLCHDEALGVPAGKPAHVVWPADRDEVAAVVRAAIDAIDKLVSSGFGEED